MTETMERRGSGRTAARFLVKYRVTAGGARDIADRIGQVRDVSGRGLALVIKRPVPPGCTIEMRIPASPLGPARTMQGRVCWAGPSQDPEDETIGIAFVVVGDEKERRRFVRRQERLLLRVKCVSKGVFHEIETRGALLADISKGGFECATTRDYAPGVLLEVTLPESPLGPQRMLHARVVWARQSERAGQYRLGCSFVRLSEPPPAEGV